MKQGIATDLADIKRIREYHKQLYRHKTDNLDKMNHFLIKYKLPKLPQYEIDNILSH